MLLFPNAKINIGLNITNKRPDGFHNIQSIFYPIGLCDALEVIENTDKNAPPVTITFSGIDIPSTINDNLCVKAYYIVNSDYPLPNIKIHLHKHIPIGAGLGGGSADAAFFLRLLNDKFELGLAWGELHNYARQLGSDCSFFITNNPAYVQGKGEQYETISLSLNAYHIVLIYPHIHINTAKAYSGVKPATPTRSLEEDILLPVEEWKHYIHNQFEDTVFPQFPKLKKIKEQLYNYGAVYAAMSGSGSTVYGIFKEKINLQEQFKEYFVSYIRTT